MGTIINKKTVVNGVVVDEYNHPKLDEFAVSFHAKRNCRDCNGRGKLEFSNPKTDTEWAESCPCIRRKL